MTSSITITYPDGSRQPVSKGSTAGEALALKGVRRSDEVIAALVNGKPVDLAYRLDADATIAPVTFDMPEGKEVYRHSSAHIMAQAVKDLFPPAKLTIGPPIEEGFYYDFAYERPFTPEDLEKIEARIQEIIRAEQPVRRRGMRRGEAIEFFRQRGEDYKCEMLQGFTDETVSVYDQGGLIDLCRGPHVPSTGHIQAIKLLTAAGAYWRGDERNPMLQRIYGTSFPTKELLDDYLHKLVEIKKRDHRKLGRELDLIAVSDEVGPALILLLPKGSTVRLQIEEEVSRVLDFTFFVLKTFGFADYQVCVSTRPEKAVGSEAAWAQATAALEAALKSRGVAYGIDPGQGVFYGPKIDIKIKDVLGRSWQCSTIQVDFNNPERFGLEFMGEDGQPHRPIMIHRALMGSIERFFGILIEQYAGAFPAWLAPVQAVVIAITDSHADYARDVARRLTEAGVRVEADLRNEKIGLKIREAERAKIPYMLVAGDREKQDGTVSVRTRGGGNAGAMTVAAFLAHLQEEVEGRALTSAMPKA